MAYTCETCGQEHNNLPDVGFRWPDYYYSVPQDEREQCIVGDTEFCAVGDEYFFIRGLLLIPITDEDFDFGIGMWVSLKKENFEVCKANGDIAEIWPFFGWLCNELRFYEESTLNLKTMARFQGEGMRPLIDVEPGSHPLADDCANGITIERAWEMVHCSH